MNLQCVGDTRAFNKDRRLNQLPDIVAIASSQGVKYVKTTVQV